jgi:hypothetical protein
MQLRVGGKGPGRRVRVRGERQSVTGYKFKSSGLLADCGLGMRVGILCPEIIK